MTEHSIVILTNLQRLIARPGMYSPNGTFDELIALINGYHVGLQNKDCEESSELKDYLEWISQKIGEEIDFINPKRFSEKLLNHFIKIENFQNESKIYLESRRKICDE